MVIYAGIAVTNRNLPQVGHVQVALTESMYILDNMQADISVNIVDTNLIPLQVVRAQKALIGSTNIYDGRITILKIWINRNQMTTNQTDTFIHFNT